MQLFKNKTRWVNYNVAVGIRELKLSQ